MNDRKMTFALGCLTLLALEGHAQSDSLTVYVEVHGPKREKFTVYFEGHHLLSTPRGGNFFAAIKLPINPAWKKRSGLEFYIFKDQFFGLFHKDVSVAPSYDPSHRFLLIHRDPYRKNNAPFTFFWSDKPIK